MKFIGIILIFCGIFTNSLCDIEVAPRLTGGQKATLGQFSHHVLIGKIKLQYTDYCSGSLIRFNWVLTSASCIHEFYSIQLYLGIVNRTATALWLTEIIEPTHVKIHENYNPNLFHNNIALIFMESAQPSILNSFIGVVNLISGSMDLSGNNGTISGFGYTSYTSGSGSNDLMFINVPIMSNSACQNLFGTALNDTNLCVNTVAGTTTCFEDRGSGLITSINGTIFLIGVASIDDCDLSRPALFTRISSYLSWINETIIEITPTTTTLRTTIPTIEPTTTPSDTNRNLTNLFVLILSCAVLMIQ